VSVCVCAGTSADSGWSAAEGEYLLEDTVNEKKFNFKLADALQRAKKIGGRLFAGHTFYVTPKVPVDLKLLRNVVTSGGGQVRSWLTVACNHWLVDHENPSC
jgi:mediator of DNA damage checkpoint protein 1